MQQENLRLRAENAGLQDWKEEKARYRMANLPDGAVVYVLPPPLKDGEAPHWLCAHCFGEGKKSMLQPRGPASGGVGRGRHDRWLCWACKAVHEVQSHLRPESFPPPPGSKGE